MEWYKIDQRHAAAIFFTMQAIGKGRGLLQWNLQGKEQGASNPATMRGRIVRSHRPVRVHNKSTSPTVLIVSLARTISNTTYQR